MKIGFAKYNKVSRELLSENYKLNLVANYAAVSEPIDLDWLEYQEKLNNEKVHGLFVTNKKLAEIKKQDEKEREELKYQHEEWLEVEQEASKLNQLQKPIFIRAEGYMKISETLRKMNFYNGEEKVKVIHAFPVLEKVLDTINKTHDVEFREIEVPEGYYVYSLNWSKVDKFVTPINWDIEAPTLEEYSHDHAAKWVAKDKYCWCGCGRWEYAYLSYSMTHQVVFSPEQLTHIK